MIWCTGHRGVRTHPGVLDVPERGQGRRSGHVQARSDGARVRQHRFQRGDPARQHVICMVCAWYMWSHSEAVPSRRVHNPDQLFTFNTRRLGAICGPIKTQFGYHLLQVVERSERRARDPGMRGRLGWMCDVRAPREVGACDSLASSLGGGDTGRKGVLVLVYDRVRYP